MTVRDHEGIVLDHFNGLYDKGDKSTVPTDHFAECDNIRYLDIGSFETRYGIGISQIVAVPLADVKRMYNYVTQTANTLIVLVLNAAGEGEIYHVKDSTTVYGPILTIDGMTDFAFVAYNGRGYISPFSSLFEVTRSPLSSLSAALVEGTGIEAGVRSYGYSYVTATGETRVSALATVTTDPAVLAPPTIAPIITQPVVILSNLLVNGGTYSWKFTIALDAAGVQETTVGPISNILVNDNTKNVGLQIGTAFPDGSLVRLYRTVDGGSTYYLEFDSTAGSNYPLTITGGYAEVGNFLTDAQLVLRSVAPTVNNTTRGAVNLSNILNGPSETISKNIWRTEAGLTQLKLLGNIPNNTTDTFADTFSDTTLGVNAPIVNTATLGTFRVEKGLEGEFLYVYAGDGTPARKAAGLALSGTMTVANGATGHTDPGVHVFGFVSETISGYLSPPGLLTSFTTLAANSVSFGSVDASGDPNVVKRHLVASKKITGFNGDLAGSQLFFVPDATINNNTDLFLNNISFYDADLLDDASHLFDNYTEIPAGAVLSLYHNRLCLATTFNDISLILVSNPGEPEAISQIDGLIVVTLDGNPITNIQEMRDVMYVMKRARTVSFIDNDDVPSSWPEVIVDNALGCPVHGVATVLDTGSSSVDFLIVCTYQGVTLFSGKYITPELSWKIDNYWKNLDRTKFFRIQIINAPIQKEIYMILPNKNILVGNYANGMDFKKMRWSPHSYYMTANTLAIVNIDEIIIGADLL